MISNYRPKKRSGSGSIGMGGGAGAPADEPGQKKQKKSSSATAARQHKAKQLSQADEAQQAELEASLFGGLLGGGAAPAASSTSKKGKGRATLEDDETSGFALARGPGGSTVRVLMNRDEEEDSDEEEDEELAQLDDDQLFTIDGGQGSFGEADEGEEEEGEDEAVSSSSETDYEADDVLREEDDDDDEESDAESQGTSPDEEDVEAEDLDEATTEGGIPSPAPAPAPRPSSKKLKTVWTDPDDARLQIALAGPSARAADGTFAGTRRLRRLRRSADEVHVSGTEYERRLRDMFRKLHPTPVWAVRSFRRRALAELQQQQRANAEEDGGARLELPAAVGRSAGPSLADLLSQEDTGLLKRLGISGSAGAGRGRARLPPGTIEMERLKNANEAQHIADEAAIEHLAFHPSASSASGSLLMTASRDRRIRLFGVTGGKSNPLLQTLHIPDMPVKTALFVGAGAGAASGASSVLISGERPFLYSWDLQSGRILRSNPWRAGIATAAAAASADAGEKDLSVAVAQPYGSGSGRSGGNSCLVAFKGRRGVVNLIDWGRSGAGSSSLVASLRSSGTLAGLAWDRSSSAAAAADATGSGAADSLVTLSTAGEFAVWDTRMLRCSVVKRDLGLFRANSLQCSPDGAYWTVGSDDGIVNVYDSASLFQGATSGRAQSGKKAAADDAADAAAHTKVIQGKADVAGPITSIKTIENLTTSITTQRFNHDAQILAVASRNKKDALRLVHFPTMRTFANWPTSGTPLGHVTSVDFSANGRFLAIGNSRGRVLLYSPKHYA